jgi:hypothetical protein
VKGHAHALRRLAADVVVGACLLVTAVPLTASGAERHVTALPVCDQEATDAPIAEVTSPWDAFLDEDGIVVSHQMTLRREGSDTTVRTGRRGFAVTVRPGRTLVGERSADGTVLTMVDTERVCRRWQRVIDVLAYDAGSPVTEDGFIRLDIHDPGTRWYEGRILIHVEHGTTEAMIDGECSTSCTPNDGEVDPAAFLAAGAARPVPRFSAGGWDKDVTLPYAWRTGAVPPTWARDPMRAGADDASETSNARSPRFVYRSTANDTIRYTTAFPDFCRLGIACASRNMPTTWAVWIRPHGYDFSWGTLRWCQRDGDDGCFDLRRVMLHELGHVAGLNHPSSAGFNLAANETVMHAVTPARPAAGSGKRAFGRCDVATLQELYDVPSASTPISTCNDVATDLSLSVSDSVVPVGSSVRLKATLRVADRDSYGQLADNPLSARSVKLKYRRAGSDADWTTLWMVAQATAGRYELSLAPQRDLELVAAFPAPDDEGLGYSASSIVMVKVK